MLFHDRTLHQKCNHTKPNRYPDILNLCYKINPKPIKILSFGCSTGLECLDIKKKFPESNIEGIEIRKNILEICKKNIIDKKINFSNNLHKKNNFDMIFCMSVFCRWPESKNLTYNNVYYFSTFEKEIGLLYRKLNKNGIIIIFNSNYRLCDTKYCNFLKPVAVTNQSGFVNKFDKNQKILKENYPHCIFNKIK
jgi:hypothetical protein